MAAGVDKDAEAPARIATDKHGLRAHIIDHEVAGLGDLRHMRHVQPAADKNPLLLQLIDLRAGKDAEADSSALNIDQLVPHRLSPLLPRHRTPSRHD